MKKVTFTKNGKTRTGVIYRDNRDGSFYVKIRSRQFYVKQADIVEIK